MALEDQFFLFFFSIMETFDPQGGASLDPRGLIGRSFVGDP